MISKMATCHALAAWLVSGSIVSFVGCGAATAFEEDTGAAGVRAAGGSAANSATGGKGGANAGTGGRGAGGTSGMTNSVTSCKQYDGFNVGSYVIETNYWNLTACPGTQCMSVDTTNGSFTVTEGPNCGDTVASYPNVLYGSAFGTVSPGSVLPKQVSTVNSVTSNWVFSVGGTNADHYVVAYDIWFCPNTACGQNGFPGGLELMIWVNYQNTYGWQYDLGSVDLGGYNWEVWTFKQGSGSTGWTYLAYMIQPTMVTTLTNFDLLAFFKDAMARGYLQSSWYLYAVQGGNEIRSGGVPYTNNSFSVSVH